MADNYSQIVKNNINRLFNPMPKGLAENLLQGRRFIKRKGKWVTPMEIAAEALEEGVRVLGL